MFFFALEQVGTTPGHVLSNYCPVPDDSKSIKTSPVLLGRWRTGHGGGGSKWAQMTFNIESHLSPFGSSSSMTRPPTTQEDRAGLDGLGVIWDWAVVAQNVPWGCPNLFQGKKKHQDHPPPCPVLLGKKPIKTIHLRVPSSKDPGGRGWS